MVLFLRRNLRALMPGKNIRTIIAHRHQQSLYSDAPNIDLEASAMYFETDPHFTAALLKRRRKQVEWSQRKLAERAGVHVQTVKYWEGKQGIVAGPTVFRMFEELVHAMMASSTSDSSNRQLCGARTRKGGRCKAKPLPGKRRCKFHGGMSTGPRTREGRQRIAEAQRRRWAAYQKAV
jgi:DNA-binding transcriptional regulator YiaG